MQHDTETEALLPTSRADLHPTVGSPTKTTTSIVNTRCPPKKFNAFHVSSAFVLGTVACLLAQYAICGTNCFSRTPTASDATNVHTQADERVSVMAPPYVGSTTVHHFPPTKPTNAYPTLFPSDVGYPGGTPTGGEPGVIATAPAYPIHNGLCGQQLLQPDNLHHKGAPTPGNHPDGDEDDFKKKKSKFNLLRSWGNLSPWYSVGKGAFGLDSNPDPPKECKVTGLHFLHRHGARYPTAWANYGGPSKLPAKLHKDPASWNASGALDFLNNWTYKLGEELLTPFGRQQLFDLGISLRMKYGFLLEKFTEKNTIPVFRTESQDRMLASALNFAIGFFGYPLDGQYQQSIIIEAPGFNNTLAPYKTCPNANDRSKADRGFWYVKRWAEIYLEGARKRLQKNLNGFELTTEDVYTMQQLCAYETVALGYSKFCEVFTEKEWEGFDYSLDLQFWYGSAYGSPVARVQGIGYVQEMVARLTNTPIQVHNSSTNSTLNDNPITFPLDQALYVDATHEVVVLNILTALNLTSFAKGGPLPYTHIPKDYTFKVKELAPFATNVQFQLLECDSEPDTQIRVIINDGVAPLTGIRGCPENKDGLCPLNAFVEAQKQTIAETDWIWECHGDWTVPEGTEWETVTGSPPPKPAAA